PATVLPVVRSFARPHQSFVRCPSRRQGALDAVTATVELRHMRLRQVVIAARDLEQTVAHLTAVFGLDVCFRDPAVAEFGLVNAVMPVGDTFLEVVSPVAATAPARRFLDRNGDGGYMVILQSERLDEDRRRLDPPGVPRVWEADPRDNRRAPPPPARARGAPPAGHR